MERTKPHPPEDIGTLLQRLHTGDAASIPRILEQILPWLQDYVRMRVRGRLKQRLETQDVVQEAIANFLRDAPRFVVQGENQFRVFVRKVADNVIRGQHRYFERQRRKLSRERPLSDLTEPVFHTGSPSRAASEAESEARMRLALEMLDPLDQRVICMKVFDGCQFEEIATAVGIQPATARQRYRRALLRLQEKVRSQQQGDVWGFLGRSGG